MKCKPVPLGLLGAIALGALATPSAAEARFGDHALKRGDQGRDVKVLQRWMTHVGVETRADGSFGKSTYRSVRRYERQFDLRVDGKVSRSQAAGLRKRAYAAAESASKRAASPRGGGGVEAGMALPKSAVGLTDGPDAVLSPDGKTALAPANAPQPVKDAIQAANRLVDKPYVYGGGHGRTDGPDAVLSPDGKTALAPANAPQPVKDAIRAANRLVDKPYVYGGGHGRTEDRGYDCSGTISYALIHGDLLDAPRPSGGFYGFGKPGKGEWITVYTNDGHMYAIVAGLRLDTSGPGESGPRWRPESRSSQGFKVRHPDGL